MARNVYKGGPKARDFDLFGRNLQYSWITPQLTRAKAISDKTLREEYSRLRAIANKRLKRMEGKAEAAGTWSQHPEGFPSVRGMSREEIVYQLGEVSGFLTARRGSLSGILESNKKITESLADKGVNVTPDQLSNFGLFMQKIKKALNISKGEYGSGQTASLWNELMENGSISKKKFSAAINDLIADIEKHREIDKEEKAAVKDLVRSTNLSKYFGELSLDPRTLAAEKRKGKRKK